MLGEAATSGVGGAFMAPLAVVAMAIVAGFILLHLFGMWFVDQSISTIEGCLVLFATLGLLTLTIAAASPILMLLPPVAGAAVWSFAARAIKRREELAHQQYLEQQEERARALIARDPTATVGYERLADVLEQRRRYEEAAAVVRHLLALTPNDRSAARHLARLEASYIHPEGPATATGSAPAPAPPAAQPPARTPVDLVLDPEPETPAEQPAEPVVEWLDDEAPPAEEPPATPPRSREEEELAAFAPPEEIVDERPTFEAEPDPEAPAPAPSQAVDDPFSFEDPAPVRPTEAAPPVSDEDDEEPFFYPPGTTAEPRPDLLAPAFDEADQDDRPAFGPVEREPTRPGETSPPPLADEAEDEEEASGPARSAGPTYDPFAPAFEEEADTVVPETEEPSAEEPGETAAADRDAPPHHAASESYRELSDPRVPAFAEDDTEDEPEADDAATITWLDDDSSTPDLSDYTDPRTPAFGPEIEWLEDSDEEEHEDENEPEATPTGKEKGGTPPARPDPGRSLFDPTKPAWPERQDDHPGFDTCPPDFESPSEDGLEPDEGDDDEKG